MTIKDLNNHKAEVYGRLTDLKCEKIDEKKGYGVAVQA